MMVFEFHFNPGARDDLIFDSFCYEPENIYEKRVGSLYMVGLLKNALPQNAHFLNNLAKVIKKEYYRSTFSNPEKSLKKSLKEANEFLERIAKKGDVSWLGNLNFGVISLKNFELNFTKVGNLKIILLRAGQIIEIDEKLKFEEIEPYPLRVFGNIVSGKLAEDDIILVLNEELWEVFQNQDLISQIAKIIPFDEKKLEMLFKSKKEGLSKVSGVCLLVSLSKRVLPRKRKTFTPKTYFKEFSLKEVFSPLLICFKELIKKPHFPKPKFPQLTKNQILILALIFFLLLGFLIAQKEEKEKLALYRTKLEKIQKKLTKAETFLILKESNSQAKKKGKLLLKESWKEISPFFNLTSNLPQNFATQILSLRDRILKDLYQLNNLILVKEPQLIFEFDPHQFIPQKMVIFNDNLYFFSPYSKNLFKLGEGIVKINQKFDLAAASQNTLLLFSNSNCQLTILSKKGLSFVKLQQPYPDFHFDDLSSFRKNLYFLDKKSGQIIKYPYQKDFQWGFPQFWLKRAIAAKGLTIDGSIWVLGKGNEIERYYEGELKEKIKLDIFPEPKDFSKIFTSPHLPYLYLLEPSQKRIIILTKGGEIVKQFQSEKFDNLLDFALSEDGKTIWLLNGLKLFKISLSK